MAKLLPALVLAAALLFASLAWLATPAPLTSVGAPVSSTPSLRASDLPPVLYYNYSDFFNVPYGEWWDLRTNYGYGDEPVGASCFNATSVANGTCTTNTPGLPRVAGYPYMDWAGSGNAASQGSATSIYAPYRLSVSALYVPGYNLSQPVFLPVTNYGTAAGTRLSFNWAQQYMDVAEFNHLTTTLGCYNGAGALANDGYQLVNRIHVTLDNQEAARLFGAPATGTQTQIQNWWNTNTLPGCAMTTSGKNAQAGPLETAVNGWFQNEANGKYDIYNGYAAAYTSLYTNITATVVTGGATGTTNVYIEHGAWGTEILLDRWFYWGNATYAGNQANSSKAKGWWGMENGWWEDVHYAGNLGATTTNFNLTGVLQYHFQEHSAPGPDGVFRSATNPNDADDTPYWTWGPMLVDYVFSSNKGPYSELDRFAGLNYLKTTPGSGDYGTNTSFDYTPISWAAKANEWWNFAFPTNTSAYYQNPATAPLGTDPRLGGQLPTITSTLSLKQIFPAGYGTWNAAAGTWSVVGGTPPNWPPSTGPGTYPYIPYPGIYLQPSTIPPVVTTDPATAITSTAATLNANLDSLGSSSNASVGFLWGTSATLAGAANVTLTPMTATGPFSHGLAGLTPGTTYYFAAWAYGAGFVRGSILNFTAGVYPPAVTTVAASAISTSGATLNGDLTDLGSAATVTVGFLWGTDPTLAVSTNVTVGSRTATGTFSHALAGLTPATTYYFRAWANGARFSAGAILGFTTGAPPVVLTDPATGITASAANLNGNLTDLGSVATVIVGFLWGTDPTLATNTNVTAGPVTQIGTFTTALASLTAKTTYYFRAWANGASFATGSILSFTTLPVPPSVTTDAATSVTPTSATLNGHTTALGTAASVSVGFLWGTSATLTGAANVTVTTQSTAGAFSHALAGLTSGTTYYFAAWVLGDGYAEGTILSFTATVLAPPTVTTNAASSITPATATLNGDLTGLGSAASVTVGFLWGTDPALAGAANVTVGPQTAAGAFTHNLVGLTPGTTYYFEAWGNGDGFGHGTIVSFATGVTPPSVTTTAASGVTTTGATLNGDLTSLGTAASATVGFLWGTSATLTGAANVTVGTQTATGAFTHALTGLTPSTTYYVRAWANGAGFAQGTILSFATGAATSPPTVTTGTGAPVSSSAALLSGNLTGLGTASSVTLGFLWGTSPSLAGAANASAGSRTTAGFFLAGLTGLTGGTTYYFQAWGNGNGFATGSIVSFATPVAAAPSVTTTAATGTTTTAATLNANLGSLGSSAAVIVGFLYGTSATLTGAVNVTVGPKIATAAFSSALTGLTPGTTYYFQAWAFGEGFARGPILSFTTQSTAPPPSEPTFLGMPALVGYSVLGIIIAVIVAVLLLVLLRRRKKETPPPPPPPPESP